MKAIKFILLLLLCFTSIVINAQIKTVSKPIVKFKPPKLSVSLGGFKDSSFIAPQMADSIIGLPLKIIDDKNVAYTLSSYQFLYRKIVVSENEATGKAYNTTSVKSSLFKVSPLPTLWLNAVRELPRPGEEFIFFDIIVKDNKDRFMYAPNLKLTIR